jgi:hypothetical protein
MGDIALAVRLSTLTLTQTACPPYDGGLGSLGSTGSICCCPSSLLYSHYFGWLLCIVADTTVVRLKRPPLSPLPTPVWAPAPMLGRGWQLGSACYKGWCLPVCLSRSHRTAGEPPRRCYPPEQHSTHGSVALQAPRAVRPHPLLMTRLRSVSHADRVCPVAESACVALRMVQQELNVGVCILLCGAQFCVRLAWSYLPVAPTNPPKRYIHLYIRTPALRGPRRHVSIGLPCPSTHIHEQAAAV